MANIEKPALLSQLSDALKRRCFYHWIDYPSFEKEMKIVSTRLPGIDAALPSDVVRFVHAVRQLDLAKPPGIAETLDCGQAVMSLGKHRLDEDVVEVTLGCLAKSMEDGQKIRDVGIRELSNMGVWQDRERQN